MDNLAPDVQRLVDQLQAQHETIGKVSSIVGYLNIEYLRNEIWNHGYNTRLADDQNTVIVDPRQIGKEA